MKVSGYGRCLNLLQTSCTGEPGIRSILSPVWKDFRHVYLEHTRKHKTTQQPRSVLNFLKSLTFVIFGKEKLLHEGLRKNWMHMTIRIKEVNLRKNCRLKLFCGNRPELVGNSAPHGDETKWFFMTRNGNKTIFLSMQVLSNLPQSVRFLRLPRGEYWYHRGAFQDWKTRRGVV